MSGCPSQGTRAKTFAQCAASETFSPLWRHHHIHPRTSEARGEIVHDDIVVFEVMTDTLDRP